MRASVLLLLAAAVFVGCGPVASPGPGPSPAQDGGSAEPTLSWSPASVDCGFASPGVEVVRTLTFHNAGAQPVRVSQLRVSGSTEVRLLDGSGVELTELSVPGGGEATLQVGFTPSELGPRQTTLVFDTDLPAQPQGSVVLRCFGGGPDLQLLPSPSLNFGKVAFFADQATTITRRLTVMNVGAQGEPLRLSDPSGDFSAPRVEVVPLTGFTSADELQVKLPASYDPAAGLEAVVGKNQADLLVAFTPTSLGRHEAELRVWSNDPDENPSTVTFTADVVSLPDCRYTVSPASLDAGTISVPDYRDLSFTVTNDSPGDPCILSNLRLAEDSDPGFSLPSAPNDSVELPGGGSVEIVVRVWPGTSDQPSGTRSIQGTVLLSVSSSSRPEISVPVTATVVVP